MVKHRKVSKYIETDLVDVVVFEGNKLSVETVPFHKISTPRN